MKARDVMVSHVITVGPELDLKAVANTLVANGISAVPVVAIDGSVVGIVSEGDLMRRAVSGAERKRSRWLETFSSAEQLMAEFVKAHGRKAKDVMTRKVISVSPDTSLQEIADLFEKHGIAGACNRERSARRHRQPRQSRAGAGDPWVGFGRRRGSKRSLAESHIVESAEGALDNCTDNGRRDCRPRCR
jgi:CBS domain-containing protein